MAKLHVSLNVSNVANSVDFYRLFFGAEPVKLKADYAKFDLTDPAINFTMNQRQPDERTDQGRLSHLGIQVGSHDEVDAARGRLAAAGMVSLDEQDTVCCYARQDKVWATDPDGNRWEIFYVMEADVEADHYPSDRCCVPVEEQAVLAGKGCC